MTLENRLRETIRDVPDFPIPGIVFKDIAPVLQDGPLFADITSHFADRYRGEVDRIVGIESRGFIFGAPIAVALGVGLTLIRKPGKLPYDRDGVDYELEYGTDRVEIHVDGVNPGDRVVVIDDLLATGGTAAATAELLARREANIVELGFVIELSFLPGREKLGDHDIYSLVRY